MMCEISHCHTFVLITDETYVGKTGLVTGWGTLKEDGKPSCTLQEVEVPVLSNDDCTSKTNYTSKMITNNMLCAGYPGVGLRDSCKCLHYKTANKMISCSFLSLQVKVIQVWMFVNALVAFLSHRLPILGGPLQVERDDKRYEIIGIVSWGNG